MKKMKNRENHKINEEANRDVLTDFRCLTMPRSFFWRTAKRFMSKGYQRGVFSIWNLQITVLCAEL